MPIVYEKEKLKDILKQYYTLSGVRIAVFDEYRREIVAYPEELGGFCSENRKQPDFLARCNQCDREAFAAADKTNAVYIYRCHCGLTEAVKSIEQNGLTLGYMMFGQFKGDSETLPAAETSDKINAGAKIMEICVNYILNEKLLRASYAGIGERIKKHLRENLAEKITVGGITRRFGLSHTTVNTVFKREEGMGVIQYLNKIRIEEAARSLRETDKTIRVIAEEIGISDVNYLSRAFKKQTGVSMSQYRRDAML